MRSNFSFLSEYAVYEDIANACIEAEKSIVISNSVAALMTRKALEIAVKWIYRYDNELSVPYQDNLSSLVHHHQFKNIIDYNLFPRIKFIIKLGNKAAHTTITMKRIEVIEALRGLYDFILWIDSSYSETPHNRPFNPLILQNGAELEKKNLKIQQDLEAKEKAWEAEKKQLQEQLKSEQERNKYYEKRVRNSSSRSFRVSDISEYQTRKIYIDLAIEMAGWEIGTNCLTEVEVSGMPTASGIGKADYVLYADNGKPLAVIEAKRTSADPKQGKVQAKLYADCLEKQHGTRPIIFYTNGFQTWMWDDTEYPEREISGFYSKDELDKIFSRRTEKIPFTAIRINNNITDRVYQKKAIRAVCDALENKQRKALLVMATGSGKTRTAISIVDVLTRHGWIKNILFLADRIQLVKQAKKNFSKLLPNLSLCNLLDNKDDPESRMIFSTYPTMMNAIDDTKRKDGSRLFTPAHFDLIIVDESHRSIYKKYQDIFLYFDSLLLGLTATPKSDLDKNTYEVFDLEKNVPTFAYELKEAIDDKYLVPYSSTETKMKFMHEGIHYDELSETEQEHWEETFDDDVKDISGEALNKFLFNDNTIDSVIYDLMEKGIKVSGGDKIGKTIIFAKNKKHADFIVKRFDSLYPAYAGKVAAAIYTDIKYVDKVIEDLSEKEKYPQIAVSVDMLDTGIDIPELVNLVFFKKVRSKCKFWQMIGRGTRLCEDLFGIGYDKKNFLIFDYCSNFEFFRINKNGIESKSEKSITEKLFIIRAEIARRLQHLDFQSEEHKAHRLSLIKDLYNEVKSIDESHFANRLKIEFIHKYNKLNAWNDITEEMLLELSEHIAPKITPANDHDLTKRFDFLMYRLELANLNSRPIPSLKLDVVTTADKLAEKGHMDQVKQHAEIISYVRSEQYLESTDLFKDERIRKALRGLIVLLEKGDTAIYYTSFEDSVMQTQENPGEYSVQDMQSYTKKVNNYLKEHSDDIVVYKLRNNKPLTDSDFKHLEKILWNELGTKDDYIQEYGDKPLMSLVAGIVGLKESAANELFSDFLNDKSLNSNQMEFVHLIVKHIIKNGALDKNILYDHPFNVYGNLAVLFDGKIDTAKEIVKKIDQLNNRIKVI